MRMDSVKILTGSTDVIVMFGGLVLLVRNPLTVPIKILAKMVGDANLLMGQRSVIVQEAISATFVLKPW